MDFTKSLMKEAAPSVTAREKERGDNLRMLSKLMEKQ